MIIVRWDGHGATMKSEERVYESVQDAQKANWAPVGRVYGHELYKQAKVNGGFARFERNSVTIVS